MSRATLLGRVDRLSGEALADAQRRFALAHSGRTGVDALQPTDVYYVLNVERVFFVGGLGSVRAAHARARPSNADACGRRARALATSPSDCASVCAQDTRAEVVSGDAYRAAEPDPMRKLAPLLVRQMNEVCAVLVPAVALRKQHIRLRMLVLQERLEDVARFCESAGVEDALEVSMLWVDRLGFDARAVLPGGRVHDVRITFARAVEKEQDAISQLTMLAQQLWEAAPAGRSYTPKPTTSA